MCTACQDSTRTSTAGQDDGLSVHEIARNLVELHSGLSRLVDMQRRQFPLFVQEKGYDNSGSNKLLTLQPQSNNRVKITAIIASSSASGATIVLGPYTIPIGTGTTTIAPIALLIDANDARTLTATSAGTLSMILMGEDMMNYGEVR